MAFIKNVVLTILIVLLTVNVYAEGLSTLMQLSKSQDAMERELENETNVFKAVKRAIENGSIAKGQSQRFIRERLKEPVVILPKDDGTEKWVYKPGYATFFDGIKIYLFFDSDKKLTGIKMLK